MHPELRSEMCNKSFGKEGIPVLVKLARISNLLVVVVGGEFSLANPTLNIKNVFQFYRGKGGGIFITVDLNLIRVPAP